MPLASLIGAGGSIIGGLLNNRQGKAIQPDKAAYQAIWGSAHAAREASKAHGFNPMALLGLGAGAQGMVMPSGPGMGNAVADAGLFIADGMRAKSAEIKQIADLQEQNKELQKRLVDQTLRPPMGGMYQRGGPSIKPPPPAPVISDYVVPSGGGVAPASGGLPVGRPRGLQWGEVIPTENYYDPMIGREVEVTPAKNIAGVHVQQGPHTLGVPVTILGEEAELDDPLAAAWFYSQALPQIGEYGLKELGKRFGDTSKHRNELTGRSQKLRDEWDAIDGTFPFRPPGYNAARGY